MAIIEFEFEGNTYECEKDARNDYRFAYGMVKGSDDLGAYFKAVGLLFPDGRHEKYMDALNGDSEKMGALVGAAINAVHAKN